MKKLFCLGCAAVIGLTMSSSATTIDISMSDAYTGLSGISFDGNLEHADAYYWRVNVDSYLQSAYAAGEVLTGAVLTIDGVNNSMEPEPNDALYVTLMDVNKPWDPSQRNQLRIYNDDTNGNYFSNTNHESDSPFDNYTASSYIGAYSDNNSTTTTTYNWQWTRHGLVKVPQQVTTNPAENVFWNLPVDLIDTYKNDYSITGSSGFVAIGLDPDCHYTGNVKLTLTTDKPTPPPPPPHVPEPGTLSLIFIGFSSLACSFAMKKRKI